MSGNILEALRDGHQADPGAPFLTVPGGRRLSYVDVDDMAARFATVLAEHGVAHGDRIVVQVEKSPEAIALYMAALQLGAVYVPLNPGHTAEEVDYFVEDADPVLFVGAEPRRGFASLTLTTNGNGSLGAAAAGVVPRREIAPCRPTDVASLVYTSGTTGRSKGAMLTHGCLLANATGLYEAWGWRTDDVLLHALPIFHVHGLFVALHLAMLGGSEVILLPRFDIVGVRAALTRSTVMMGVPTYYTRLLDSHDFGAEGCRTVRLFVSGSAPLSEVTHAQFAGRTGHRILERYGMSEAGMICSNPLEGERIGGTVGYPVAGYEVRVRSGDVGELEIRGPSLFAGYWRRPDMTEDAFTTDGWFRTGDLASIAEDGRVSLHGRDSDLIISGGYNVYPKEIEHVLDDVPGVTESAVVGMPDPDLGERVFAFVVGEASDDDLRAAVSRRLARYKHPAGYARVAELPRNAMGKVQKAELRNKLEDGPPTTLPARSIDD